MAHLIRTCLFIASCVLAFTAGAFSVEAASLEGQFNGTFDLIGPIPAPTEGSFIATGGTSADFSADFFGVLEVRASVNGIKYEFVNSVGNCPVSFCGSFPTTCFNGGVGGSEVCINDVGFASVFPISNSQRTLTISSSADLAPACLQPDCTPPKEIFYNVIIDLPDGLSLRPVPLPASVPLFATGLGALGLLAWRRRRADRHYGQRKKRASPSARAVPFSG